AAAEVAGEPVAHLLVRRLRILFQKRLRSDEDAGRADPALQRRMIDEMPLERVKLVAVRHPLDGRDLRPLGLDPEDEAGTDEPAVQRDRTRAAIAGAAAFLRAGHAEAVPERVEQRLVRCAEELAGVAVDR